MASRNIADLHKDFQGMVTALLERGQKAIAHTGYTLFITDGFRSMDEQAKLYAQGRTTSGAIVTMAQPGQSPHNYGLAVDLAFQKNKELSYSNDLYALIDPIARELGFVLGADWTKFKDRPHFEYPYWQQKIKEQTTSAPPITTGKRYVSHRNIEVIVEQGLNVRTSPSTKATSLGNFAYKQVFAAVAFIEGEAVSGNNLWWVTQDEKFVWSGGTNVVPTVPKDQPAPPSTPPAPVVATDMNVGPAVSELQSEIERLRESAKQAALEKSKLESLYIGLQNELTVARSEAANNELIKSSNEGLLAQISAYKEKQIQLKKDLRTAYVQAFSEWVLVQIPAGPTRLSLIIKVLFKVMGLLFVDPKQNHVIGWKLNARIVSESEPLE